MEQPLPDLTRPTEDLRLLCGIGLRISRILNGVQGRTDQQYYAQLLFARIVMTAISVLRLVRSEDPDRSASPLLDPASVASLTRNLMEAYDVFFYLGIEKVSREKEEFRSLLWGLCYDTDFDKINARLGLKTRDSMGFRELLSRRTRNELIANPFFQQLSPKQQTDLLRGKKPMYGPTNNAERWKYLDREKVSGLYKYLSNYVHMHPIAVEMSIPLIFRRTLDHDFLLPTCMDATVQHLSLAIIQYVRKLRRYAKQISPEERTWIHAQLQQPSALR